MTANHRAQSRRTITLTVQARLFMVAVAVFAAVIGWVLFLLIDADAALNRYVHAAHAQRLINQRDTQKQIRELACQVVKPFPDSSGDLIKGLRSKYHCPPFDPANAPAVKPTPKSSRTPGHAVGRPTTATTTSTTTSVHTVVVVAAGHTVATSTATRTVHVPQPKPTPTPHPTKPTSTSATPKPSPTVILHLGESTCVIGVLSVCVLGG